MMRRHAELLAEHMGEERGCKEFRKHVSWYLKGFRAGGTLRHSLALVDSLAALDALLAELDPDEPFPVPELGTPRGRQGIAAQAGRAARGLARRHRRQPARTCARMPPRSPAGDATIYGAVTGNTPLETFLGSGHDSVRALSFGRTSVPRGTPVWARTPVSNSKGSALWHTNATSGTPMPARACHKPAPREVLALWPDRSPSSRPPPSVGIGVAGLRAPSTRDDRRRELAPASWRPRLPASGRRSRGSPVERLDRPRRPTRRQLDVNRQPRRDHARAIRKADTKLLDHAPTSTCGRAADDDASKIGLLEAAKKVLVTGRKAHGRASRSSSDGKARWVTAGYLRGPSEKPEAGGRCPAARRHLHQRHRRPDAASAPTSSPSTRPCARASPRSRPTARSAATASTPRASPSTSWSAASRGWEVAEFVRAHYAELGVNYVIYTQQHLVGRPRAARAGAAWRTVARPPPTTTTTSTSRRTEPSTFAG